MMLAVGLWGQALMQLCSLSSPASEGSLHAEHAARRGQVAPVWSSGLETTLTSRPRVFSIGYHDSEARWVSRARSQRSSGRRYSVSAGLRKESRTGCW